MRHRTHSSSEDGGDEDDEREGDPKTPGQMKKEAFSNPRGLFGGIFNARNVQRLVGTLAEVGNSIGNIVAPLPDDFEDDEQQQQRRAEVHAPTVVDERTQEMYNSPDSSMDEVRYQRESKSKIAELAVQSPNTSTSMDEIDLSMASPRSLSPTNNSSFSPAPFSLSVALLSSSEDKVGSMPATVTATAAIPQTSSSIASGPLLQHRASSAVSPPIVSFIANEELQKIVQVKYRDSMEMEISVLERRAREQNVELRDLEGRLTSRDVEIERLTAELHTLSTRSSGPDVSSVPQHEDVEVNDGLQKEVERLEKALLASEEALKGAEVEVWQAKAEAAELIFALNLEQEKRQRATSNEEQLTIELASVMERVKDLENKIAEQAQRGGAKLLLSNSTAEAHEEAASPALLTEESHKEAQTLHDINLKLKHELSASTEQIEVMAEKAAEELKKADATKAALIKADKENQQLQVVIKQLQQKQKGSRDDIGVITAERDALLVKVAELEGDAEELARLSSQAGKLDIVNLELESTKRHKEQLEAALEEAKRRQGELEKANYDLTESQQTVQSDTLLMQQELEQRKLEINNLRDALQQLKREHSVWKSRNQEDIESKLDLQLKEHQIALLDVETSWRLKLGEQEESVKLAQQRLQDEALLRRKAEIDLANEKRKLKKTLDETLAQLRNSQEDVVDRALISNLIVAYFARGRPLDGLQLLARVLGFTEEQQEVVGLLVPKDINLIGTLYTTIVGAPPKTPVNVEGDNLLEMWANFLEMEASDAAKSKTGAAFIHIPSTPSLSDRQASTAQVKSHQGP